MTDTQLLVAILAVLAVAGAIAAGIVLARLGALMRERETLQRDLASVAKELAIVRAQGEDLERDLKQDIQGARAEMRQDLAIARGEQSQASQVLRVEVGDRLTQFTGTTQQQFGALVQGQGDALKAFGERLQALTQGNDQKLEAIRASVEQRLDALRNDNAAKLEQMRQTVDEKLHATLEVRLSSSFQQVSERLTKVHEGLGEMQALAVGVGDLKRALTNVKTRGLWGEVALGNLLADLLTPAQYAKNVATRPGSAERVEFAVRLPGRGDDEPCWLPIDAKFPMDDWQRLQDAVERADAAAVEASRRALDGFFRQEAKSIRDKYVEPPHTTDFAILFVPTEGLFAEAVARPGLADTLQRDYRVTLAGPTTLSAMLNSLQLGFRTLAIEKRTTEVWKTLSAVRTEFGKFGDVLARARKKLDEAGNTLDEARGKTTTIARRLRAFDEMPGPEAARLLELDGPPDAPAALAPDEPPIDAK